jgi:hypothetical protein
MSVHRVGLLILIQLAMRTVLRFPAIAVGRRLCAPTLASVVEKASVNKLDILGSHGGEHEHGSPLGCRAVYCVTGACCLRRQCR